MERKRGGPRFNNGEILMHIKINRLQDFQLITHKIALSEWIKCSNRKQLQCHNIKQSSSESSESFSKISWEKHFSNSTFPSHALVERISYHICRFSMRGNFFFLIFARKEKKYICPPPPGREKNVTETVENVFHSHTHTYDEIFPPMKTLFQFFSVRQPVGSLSPPRTGGNNNKNNNNSTYTHTHI